jgi:hypothetical protein
VVHFFVETFLAPKRQYFSLLDSSVTFRFISSSKPQSFGHPSAEEAAEFRHPTLTSKLLLCSTFCSIDIDIDISICPSKATRD